ncbi:M6 family metalloprotease domain-containing protein [Paenibacillus tianmuensis]|uniref:M6 family metalloprotease domain-containing protein n=1 Tax=Paenibacillus tianmuensis TaxID=624147 RepID=A0A1G4SFY5_9BACL|nr:M6 family metalloprotease domain-containing protein [Paenibacillus tianmuensis]SCW67485.1 M6 family metalloprotease domain-containing protein [Paenibacillus tianmuensis]
MKKLTCSLIISGLAYFGTASVSLGVPAYGGTEVYKQPTGETFQAALQGDEWLNWTKGMDDEVLVRDENGFWNYAEIDGIKLKPSGAKVNIDPQPAQALKQEQLMEWAKEQQIVEKIKSNVAPFLGEPDPGPSLAPINTGSSRKLLVMLVEFADIGMKYSDSEWNDRFFGNKEGTVKHYYKEVSAGKMTIGPAAESYGTAGDGIVRVKLGYPHPNTKGDIGEANKKIVRDAIAAADPYVNFASFDTNNDGKVTRDELFLVTVTAGYETAYGGDQTPRPSLWAHRWSAGTWQGDGKTVNLEYIQQGEIHGRPGSADHMATMGVLVHEIGHLFGLPDLYDSEPRNGESMGIGPHSLMAGGSWTSYGNNHSGSTPVHMDAWSKYQLGWVKPTEVNANGSFTLNSFQPSNPNAYNVVKINTSTPGQFFLLENRGFTGYDRGLEKALNGGKPGVAIWHVDETQKGNGDVNRKLVDLEEANEGTLGYSQLDTNKKGVKYDHYYASGVNTSFGPKTKPSSTTYEGVDTKISVNVNSPGSSAMKVGVKIGGTTGSGKATSVPGSPSLNHNNWSNEKDYAITMDMWWGNNGDQWRLYENDTLVHEEELTDNSSQAQNAVKTFTNQKPGTYIYTAELINSFGTTKSSPITVRVK